MSLPPWFLRLEEHAEVFGSNHVLGEHNLPACNLELASHPSQHIIAVTAPDIDLRLKPVAVQDEAAVDLVVDFYRELKDSSISRAAALQRAQLKLINNPRYEHPGFWSPFLMINNWL